MPLHDHFRGELARRRPWEGFHRMWIAAIVQHLAPRLPEYFFAEPHVHLGLDFSLRDVFELAVYDEHSGRRLVAVVELVSPRNKDRPDARRDFVMKCAAYLNQRISVIVLDIVTERHSDLWGELLALLDQETRKPWPGDPPLYAVALRTTKAGEHWQMDAWEEPLALGGPLPTVPLWLADNLVVPVELEASYEDTCRVLKIA
jgi:hypothetical protein